MRSWRWPRATVPLVACLPPPTYRTEFRAPAPSPPATRAGRVERRADTRAQGPGGQAAGVARERAEAAAAAGEGRGGGRTAYLDLVPVDGVPAAGAIHLRRAAAVAAWGSVRLCVCFPRRRVVAARGRARAVWGRLKEGKKCVRLPCSGLSVSVRRVWAGLACGGGDLTVPDAPRRPGCGCRGSVTGPGVWFQTSLILCVATSFRFPRPFPYARQLLF